MKYAIVKQFYNNAIDNIFKFVFKIVDFWKILYEALWGFFEIWVAFYLIFYNFFMYFYYLILFGIDRGADESRSTVIFWKRLPKRVSSAPVLTLSNAPNPIPAMYGKHQAITQTAEKVFIAAKSTIDTSVSSGKAFLSVSGGKRSVLKLLGEGLLNLFSVLGRIVIKPVETFTNFFNRKLKPVRDEEEKGEQKGRSLIDEYMKEYEKRRKF